jgi:uncharacterized protein (DUF486 family)
MAGRGNRLTFGAGATDSCRMPNVGPYLAPILLLLGSNVFMTFAWYGHLKFRDQPLIAVILVSWGIALLEYLLAVPANRIGAQVYSAPELKAMQEVITLLVFAVFSALYLGQRLSLTQGLGFLLIAGGAYLVFRGPPH